MLVLGLCKLGPSHNICPLLAAHAALTMRRHAALALALLLAAAGGATGGGWGAVQLPSTAGSGVTALVSPGTSSGVRACLALSATGWPGFSACLPTGMAAPSFSGSCAQLAALLTAPPPPVRAACTSHPHSR
jgi:hypothetical protein